jgi:hypothetical protein
MNYAQGTKMKDFLFFNYDWVANSTYLFKSFDASGYTCDFVNEQQLQSFIPTSEYRVVVAYLHEPWQIPIINRLMSEYFTKSFFVQHDDTDEEHVQHWFAREPDLIMQRELTANSRNPYTCPTYPQHFPIPSIHRPNSEKQLDVVFMGTPTNPGRVKFVEKLVQLSTGALKHLKWGLQYSKERAKGRNPELFIRAANSTRIGLNYPGNSKDQWRTWELASAGCAILMPESPLLSIRPEHQPFDEYVRFNADLSDLEEKIVWLLAENRWEIWGQKAKQSYELFHTPEKCFEHYHEYIMKHVPVKKRDIVPHSAEKYFEAWRMNPNNY